MTMRSLLFTALVVAAVAFGSATAKDYTDKHWKELPKGARKAAGVLGYTGRIWDEDLKRKGGGKPFNEFTALEKRAAAFLGLSAESGFHKKKWDELDPETRKYAEILTWNKDEWDGKGKFTELYSDWYWKDMHEDQKEAAMYFGYTQLTWDEDPKADDFKLDEEK